MSNEKGGIVERFIVAAQRPDFMKLDPKLVPYNEEWTDNNGGMANAIFWLEEHWNSNLNAQGDRHMPDGGRWCWVYSPHTEVLMVHEAGGKSYEIDREKMVVIDKRGRDMAEIYRPFFPREENGIGSKPKWLRTRHVEVVKNDYVQEAVPLYLHKACENLCRILKAGFIGLEKLDYSELVPPVNLFPRKTRVSHNIAQLYLAIVNQVKACNVRHAISAFDLGPVSPSTVTEHKKLIELLRTLTTTVCRHPEAVHAVSFSSEELRLAAEVQVFDAILTNIEDEQISRGAVDEATLLHQIRTG